MNPAHRDEAKTSIWELPSPQDCESHALPQAYFFPFLSRNISHESWCQEQGSVKEVALHVLESPYLGITLE